MGAEDPLVPTLALANHASGQVPDKFTYTTPVTDTLFQFNLSRGGAVTVSAIRVNFTTGGGVANGDVSDGELWKDDGDGLFEGAGQDTQLKDNVTPSAGVIGFTSLTEDPGTTGTTYFVRATVGSLASGDTTTLSVGTADIDVAGGVIEWGSITNATHTQESVRFRSVGTTTTSLNTGSRTVEISGNTATFSGSMPANVGVGDVLQYPTGGPYYLAVIHARVSDTVYSVYSTAGGTPQAAAAGTGVSVYRAYTSLSRWESQDENDSLDDSVEFFDASTNLVGQNAVMNVACYADGADVLAVTVSGWSTSATNYIRIYTPTSTAEVGATQRHAGVWDTTKYRLEAGGEVLRIQDGYVRVDGLQVRKIGDAANTGGIIFTKASDTGASSYELSNTIVRGQGASRQNVQNGVRLYSAGTGNLKAWNNIVYGWPTGATSVAGISLEDVDYTSYVYNNTVVGNDGGIVVLQGTVVAKNNLASGNWDNYVGTFDASSTNNLSNTGDAPGSSPRNAAVTFVNAGLPDYHLATNDTGAQGYGADLSADANLGFATDIDGTTRGAPWDIGADEVYQLLLSDHASGQAPNAFSAATVTDVLFRFRLTRLTAVTVDNVRVAFTTSGGVANGDVTSGELWQDANGNGTLETGSDTLLAGERHAVGGRPHVHHQFLRRRQRDDVLRPGDGVQPRRERHDHPLVGHPRHRRGGGGHHEGGLDDRRDAHAALPPVLTQGH